MKRWILLVFGTAFIAAASLLASEQAWIEAVSESFVPYGAVPLVIGYASRRAGVATAAVWGAGANAELVVAFCQSFWPLSTSF